MKVIGFQVRTSNDKAMANIPGLWEKFMRENEKVPGGKETVALYHHYESDHTGEYDYVLGKINDDSTPCPEGMVEVPIPEQKYEVRHIEKLDPMSVIMEWKKIWEDKEMKRTFKVDFETYDKDAGVNINVGVQ